jgi:hypothetical protein
LLSRRIAEASFARPGKPVPGSYAFIFNGFSDATEVVRNAVALAFYDTLQHNENELSLSHE